jgi:hypothetical protein
MQPIEGGAGRLPLGIVPCGGSEIVLAQLERALEVFAGVAG